MFLFDVLLYFILFSALVGIPYWLYKSAFNYVNANEICVRVLFGKADAEVYMTRPQDDTPSRLFVPWLPDIFKCSLERFPLGPIDLDYDPIKVLSRAGKYPADTGEVYGSVKLSVESMAYLNFPRKREMLVGKETNEPICFIGDLPIAQREDLERAMMGCNWQTWETTYSVPEMRIGSRIIPAHDEIVILEKTHPLIKILRAGISTEKLKLQDWSEEAMVSSVRSAAAQITWKEANEDPMAFQSKVEDNYLKMDGVLIRAGFRPSGIKLAIKLVDLPEEVNKALSGQEASAYVANREATEVGGALTKMVDEQITAMLVHCPRMTKADKMRVREECLNQLTRDRTMKGGGKLTDIRLASADGSPFGKGTIAELVAGVVAAVTASSALKGQSSTGRKSGRGKKPKDMTTQELSDAAFPPDSGGEDPESRYQ